MINPADIQINELPSVALADKDRLPETPSIYFAIDSQGVVQYIGRSVNPRHRWLNHHRYDQLSEMSGVKIAYVGCPMELLDDIEQALIDWFGPLLNGCRFKPASRPISFEELSVSLLHGCTKFKLKFSQWLKLARENAGVSQQRLADEIGVKVQTVGNWEGGRANPKLDLDQTFKFCSLLKVGLETAAKAYRGEIETSE